MIFLKKLLRLNKIHNMYIVSKIKKIVIVIAIIFLFICLNELFKFNLNNRLVYYRIYQESYLSTLTRIIRFFLIIFSIILFTINFNQENDSYKEIILKDDRIYLFSKLFSLIIQLLKVSLILLLIFFTNGKIGLLINDFNIHYFNLMLECLIYGLISAIATLYIKNIFSVVLVLIIYFCLEFFNFQLYQKAFLINILILIPVFIILYFKYLKKE